ncbi:Possible flagellar protein [hydrothermal vent metagenome]|uniref:Possible flagellar protein n=1 Tax=hydrothermal vent metagenome TaxID=652676 RepID=A0A1W1B9H3_9ZZZZ
MDGIANVAKQQTQVNLAQDHAAKTDQISQTERNQATQESSNKKIEDENKKLFNNEKDVKKLVEDLNKEISLLNTTLRFGVDKSDVFYVSVIDKKTDKVIRRWPAEHAQSILPKMKEFTGMLFDTRG